MRNVEEHESDTKAKALIRVEENSAVITGASAAALALLNPVLGIIAAGLAPIVANRISQLYASRLDRVAAVLKERSIDFGNLLGGDSGNVEAKADLLTESLGGALNTSSREKVEFLIHMLEFGLKSQTKIEILFAKRVARTISRIDELEMILLASLSRMDRNLSGVKIVDLASQSGIGDVNIVRSGLAVLSSEGLVIEQVDQFKMSDYGENVLRELRNAMGPRTAAK
ncbi:MAG: hypothetical protein WAN65_14540 [Candidatus Sulfotelmatobacter sp.]